MAKFYVQCGSYQLLTSADSPQAAAIWAVHRFLVQQVDIENIDWLDPASADRVDVIRAILDLNDWIAVSEIGFDRHDAGLLEASAVVCQWHQLVIATVRLEARITRARSTKAKSD